MAMLSEFLAGQYKSPPSNDEVMRIGLYARWATEHARINAGGEEGRVVRPRQASVHFRAAKAWRISANQSALWTPREGLPVSTLRTRTVRDF